ncbi:hypothetical protein, partial [Niastella caeni]|uniref:hypothetical protein n=1 Tax=Niastella caeni TaxID=2569763 RepID=UPI001AA05DAC
MQVIHIHTELHVDFLLLLRRQGSNLRPPTGGYEPTFTAPHRNNDTIRVIKKAPVTEPFPLLRRQGSNLRPPAGGYEPTFTAPHRNNDTIRVIKKAPVTEPFPLLRRQGSNLRPP